MMTPEEKHKIESYAAGVTTLRDEVIEIYRHYIITIGPRGDKWMAFMAEVDNPSPDLMLRSKYRTALLSS